MWIIQPSYVHTHSYSYPYFLQITISILNMWLYPPCHFLLVLLRTDMDEKLPRVDDDSITVKFTEQRQTQAV